MRVDIRATAARGFVIYKESRIGHLASVSVSGREESLMSSYLLRIDGFYLSDLGFCICFTMYFYSFTSSLQSQ